MQKVLLILLLICSINIANAQKIVKFYGEKIESSNSKYVSFLSEGKSVKFISSGKIEINGVTYEKVYDTSYQGVDIQYNGFTTYRLSYPQKNNYDKSTYAIISNNNDKLYIIMFMNHDNSPYNYGEWHKLSYTRKNNNPSPSPTPSPSPNINSTPSPTPSPTPNVDQGRTCAGCRGTGICTMCQGKGGYYTNSGTYTGSGSKTWHQCSSCHGSGKCGVCYGRGTIR